MTVNILLKYVKTMNVISILFVDGGNNQKFVSLRVETFNYTINRRLNIKKNMTEKWRMKNTRNTRNARNTRKFKKTYNRKY